MSNIDLKVIIEKNFDFPSLKKFVTKQFFRSSNWRRYWILKLVATRKSEVWERNFVWFFIILIFKRIMTF